ncbi:hypothetical protein KC675_03715 [Candidatus Dojkabacteria bacterium]|jgi:hypothetical protein|uniref:Uncharacterized protein n=1 Tax=Candidatus Dojkabacteria bacterium TaxID=2099670 RepID=A0A955I9H9_9BACT|nr:hypothetical protein [Candidatus Dojkabacteria bacterium]
MTDKSLSKKVHKTKSAIAVISGYLQLLDRNISDLKDSKFVEKNKKLISKANDSCVSLLSQIENIENDLD